MTPPSEWALVTGGLGFLGRRMVRRLLELAVPARVLVRPGTSEKAVRTAISAPDEARVEIFPASFNDRDALAAALAGVSLVLHGAASKRGSPASQVANTVVGSDNLFRASCEAGVSRFVLVSSFGVIGAASLPRGALIDEQAPLEPHPEWRDPYSFAKHRQEQLAWRYHRESGLPLVIIRPGVIFGPGESILTARIGLGLLGLFLHLGGVNVVPLTYVENCADAIVQAGRTPGIEGEVFVIVDDGLPTARELLHRYRREVSPMPCLSLPYPLLYALSRLNEWYSSRTSGHLPPVFTPYKARSLWGGNRFSNTKAKHVLAWSPRVSMAVALDATFASYQRP